MKLNELYDKINNNISALDLNSVWPGFRPLKFALYNDETCFFDGRYIEKTDEFCANTSVVYRGEQIAIWNVDGELKESVLTSKIVHEMFHGYQNVRGWDCWPDELEALQKYEYRKENLCLKLHENELLLKLSDRFDEAVFEEFLRIRKLRSVKFPYEFSYECRVEEIEGSANYVEWQVLKQLDPREAESMKDEMHDTVTKAERLFPIRISCYFTGALLVNAMLQAGNYSFADGDRPVILRAIENILPYEGAFDGKTDCDRTVSEAISSFTEETKRIVQSAVDKNGIVLNGPAELGFVNIYDARHLGNFLTSRYFLMYRQNRKDETVYGNFVIRMKDAKTIETVYKW